jgi:very-short-patch-repair endonuclease
MQALSDTVDRLIATIAATQHGVVARRQLLAAGVSRAAIADRLHKGSLIRVHPGVYRVGHAAPSMEADYLAAVLACGDGAVLSGRAAAHLLGIVKGKPPVPEVTARVGRQIPGVDTSRARKIDPRDVTKHRGIPVTTPARTLVSLAAAVTESELAYAVHQAGILHRTAPEDVEDALSRQPNARGVGTLRDVLRGDTHITASKLERAFLKLLRHAGLPLPETNKPAGGRYVDCRWPDHKLTVELDSYRYHASRHAWELDRKRERQAHARGDQFRRYTWDDVTVQTRPVLRELSAVLVGAAV